MITLKTLPQATAQEVFDQVARHLLTQKVRSVNEYNECMYRAPGPFDLKCAAGCLIADDEYRRPMEKAWRTLVALGEVPEEHATLIGDLQKLHDSKYLYDSVGWRRGLSNIAETHFLSPAVLEEFSDEPS